LESLGVCNRVGGNLKNKIMSAIDIISVVGLIGLGGLLKSSLDFFIENRIEKNRD